MEKNVHKNFSFIAFTFLWIVIFLNFPFSDNICTKLLEDIKAQGNGYYLHDKLFYGCFEKFL